MRTGLQEPHSTYATPARTQNMALILCPLIVIGALLLCVTIYTTTLTTTDSTQADRKIESRSEGKPHKVSRPDTSGGFTSDPRQQARVLATPMSTTTPGPSQPKSNAQGSGSIPRSISIAGPHFTIDTTVCPMPYIVPLNPPSNSESSICWVESGFGGLPSAHAPRTAYFPGHAWSGHDYTLNPLSELVTTSVNFDKPESARAITGSEIRRWTSTALNGRTITIDTADGALEYTITHSWLVAKEDAGNDYELMDQFTPDRIIIITCAIANGNDLDYNVIVSASPAHNRPTDR